MKFIALFFLLLVLAKSGPFGVASCIAACTVTALSPPAYAACVSACSTSTFWACFDQNTTVVSSDGMRLLSSMQIGDMVQTENMLG
jgi:hypothetical protein